MFIGHFAVGFYGKKVAPKVSLGTLFLAAQFLDLLWPILLLLGIEHVRIDPGNTLLTPLDFYDYPVSHSLLAVAGWSLGFGGAYYFLKRNLVASGVLAICVLSHWGLDLIVHRSDLPLAPWASSRFGLGLWNVPIASIVLELLLFIGGVWVYLRSAPQPGRARKLGLLGLVVLLVGIWIGNFMGPPPPNTTALAIVANAQWLFVFLGYWIDRKPKARPAVL